MAAIKRIYPRISQITRIKNKAIKTAVFVSEKTAYNLCKFVLFFFATNFGGVEAEFVNSWMVLLLS